jgi:hypothetical protein
MQTFLLVFVKYWPHLNVLVPAVFQNLCFSPNIFRIIKSRRMRLIGHVTRMGRREMRVGFWWESQKERANCEKLDADWRIILRCILE